ncbi:MAG TPA: fatty acid desaturase [Vicinamibacterales bacterium]|nr:fatty acid desaturase [Vicinamibacterales bacterium]
MISVNAVYDAPPVPAGDEALDVVTRQLVSDLHTLRPAVFWMDLFASAIVGWTAFAMAVVATPFSSSMLVACAVSAFALYRGLCFIHELAHVRRGAVRGFETAWNLLFGVPLLLPSFTYLGVHQSHHNLSTYGTGDDPEYLPFARSRRLIVVFAVQSSLVIPAMLLVRFLVLAPVGLAWPRFHRWLEARASSFAMNPAYRRIVPDAMAQKMRRWEAAMLIVWAALLASITNGVLPFGTLPVWYGVLVLVSFLNTLRVLGAHDYESDGAPRDREGQLSDSIDTPGGPWTELWAPVGLRYHALHHYFPGIPYHNLGLAYRRIVRQLPAGSCYRESTSPSLRWSLSKLCLHRRVS